ncbi:polysaccharide deacetylase family protein [Candidatus Omnitrophota bacterium]
MQYLRSNFNIISPDELDTYNCKEPAFIISFDDGFYSQFRMAVEVLNPMGIKALFFICPIFANSNGDEANRFILEKFKLTKMEDIYSKDCMPMTWTQVKSLQDAGHTIGAHTMNHVRLSLVNDTGCLEREIVESGDECERMLGRKVDWFACPFGDAASIDSRSLQIIGRRYKYCCSSVRGINSAGGPRFCILRQTMELDKNLKYLKMVAGGGLDLFYYFDRAKIRGMWSS